MAVAAGSSCTCKNENKPRGGNTSRRDTMSPSEERITKLLFFRSLPIDQPPYTQGVFILQFVRKQYRRKTLVAYRPGKPLDGPRSDGSGPAIGGGRIRTSMYHGMAYLHSCWIVIDDQPTGFLLQYGDQPLIGQKIFLRAVDTHGKVSVQGIGSIDQFILPPGNQQSGRAKYFLLQGWLS